MKRSFIIELYREGDIGKCYAVKFDGNDENEAEIFEETQREKNNSEFRNINTRLNLMLNKHKFKPPWLKLKEGKREDKVIALKTPETSKNYGLRWYGLLCTENILILGNGGIKYTNTYQEDPDLHKCVKDLQFVDKCLDKRLARKLISFDSETFMIKGNLEFLLKDFEEIEYPKE